MSFLAEVLSVADKMDVDSITKNIPIICQRISHFKIAVDDFIDREYVTFSRLPKSNSDLVRKCTEFNAEVDDLVNRVNSVTRKEIPGICRRIESLSADLEGANYELKIVTQVVHIHETLTKIIDFQAKSMFPEAVTEVVYIEELVDKLPPLKVGTCLQISAGLLNEINPPPNH